MKNHPIYEITMIEFECRLLWFQEACRLYWYNTDPLPRLADFIGKHL